MFKSIISTLLFFSISFSGVILGAGLALANSPTPGNNELALTANYFANANNIVNQQITDLLNFFDELDIDSDNYTEQLLQAFSSPQFIDQEGQVISVSTVCSNNFSASCLNQKLSQELLNFISRLGVISETLTQTSDIDSILNAGADQSNQSEFIFDQIELAHNLNLQVVEFYSQILQAYPMHIQNQRIINELELLLVNLTDFKLSMEPFSNIFHNVTSACE